jgi:hypothetical protein
MAPPRLPAESESSAGSAMLLLQLQVLEGDFYLFCQKKKGPYMGEFLGKLVKPSCCTIIMYLQQQYRDESTY